MFAEYCNRVREMNVGFYWFRFHAQATYCLQFWAWVHNALEFPGQRLTSSICSAPSKAKGNPLSFCLVRIHFCLSICLQVLPTFRGESRPLPQRHTLRSLLPVTGSSSRWGGRVSYILKGSKLLPQIFLQNMIRIASGSFVLRKTKGILFKKKLYPAIHVLTLQVKIPINVF